MKQATAMHKMGNRVFRKRAVSSPKVVNMVLVNGSKDTLAEIKENTFAQENR
jgi:hypothetical protein